MKSKKNKQSGLCLHLILVFLHSFASLSSCIQALPCIFPYADVLGIPLPGNIYSSQPLPFCLPLVSVWIMLSSLQLQDFSGDTLVGNGEGWGDTQGGCKVGLQCVGEEVMTRAVGKRMVSQTTEKYQESRWNRFGGSQEPAKPHSVLMVKKISWSQTHTKKEQMLMNFCLYLCGFLHFLSQSYVLFLINGYLPACIQKKNLAWFFQPCFLFSFLSIMLMRILVTFASC